MLKLDRKLEEAVERAELSEGNRLMVCEAMKLGARLALEEMLLKGDCATVVNAVLTDFEDEHVAAKGAL